jgi:CO dehydrogenase/acetyl-CoA synthase delta subunit
MGKISEIIGKRAANMSGEVMVEVSSGKQQLKTQYTQRTAAHTEAGSEINRDEIPLAYQQYVQQYFEEIRKLPAGKAKAKGSGN